MMAFRSGFEMSLGYYLVAGITVGLGLFNPPSWPPMFGSFSQGYTLRNLWGKCWHQKCVILGMLLTSYSLSSPRCD